MGAEGNAGVPAPNRNLLRGGVVAGPLFIAIFTLEGARRAGYKPARHPVSSLALGPRGWSQTANFAVTGALYLGAACGLLRISDPSMSKRAGPVLIGVAAGGIAAAALFPTDPVSGYPPGTPEQPAGPSVAGTLHNLVAIPTFLGLPAAAVAYSWRFARSGKPGWAAYSATTAISMLIALGRSAAGFNQSPRFVDVGGRWQRICIALGFSWLTALTTRAIRNTGTATPPRS